MQVRQYRSHDRSVQTYRFHCPATASADSARAMIKRVIIPVIAIALASHGCAKPPPVTSAEAACATATAQVTAERGLPISHVAVCDPVSKESGRPGYQVLALRAHCREELCGSTLMGWFAVREATGEVFEVDVTDWKPGRRVDGAA